jgi:aarF domain-containing kinase
VNSLHGKLVLQLFLMDTVTIDQICREWGINDPSLFASATLMRPYNPAQKKALHISSTEAVPIQDVYEMQMAVKHRIKQFLHDEELIPRELIFIGRNMNIVRALNRELGNPVNRINTMGLWAVKGLGADWSLWDGSAKPPSAYRSNDILEYSNGLLRSHEQPSILSRLVFVLRSRFNYWMFRGALFLISVSFYVSKAREVVEKVVFGQRRSRNFEEMLDEQIRLSFEEQFGIPLDDRIFEG